MEECTHCWNSYEEMALGVEGCSWEEKKLRRRRRAGEVYKDYRLGIFD
jgi:hypothetical protein